MCSLCKSRPTSAFYGIWVRGQIGAHGSTLLFLYSYRETPNVIVWSCGVVWNWVWVFFHTILLSHRTELRIYWYNFGLRKKETLVLSSCESPGVEHQASNTPFSEGSQASRWHLRSFENNIYRHMRQSTVCFIMMEYMELIIAGTPPHLSDMDKEGHAAGRWPWTGN